MKYYCLIKIYFNISPLLQKNFAGDDDDDAQLWDEDQGGLDDPETVEVIDEKDLE